MYLLNQLNNASDDTATQRIFKAAQIGAEKEDPRSGLVHIYASKVRVHSYGLDR
jgi:hypothetical protein